MDIKEHYIDQLESELKRLREEASGYQEALRTIARFYVAPYDVSGSGADLRRVKEIADSALVEAAKSKGKKAQ